MEFMDKLDQDIQVVVEARATLHVNRVRYNPEMPQILQGIFAIQEGGQTSCLTDPETCKAVSGENNILNFIANYYYSYFLKF